MGLGKSMILDMDNYHKITSVEFHPGKQQLRIRTEIFENKQTRRALDIHREYTVNEKILINASEGEATRAVPPKEIEKLSLKCIQAAEKDLEKGTALGKSEKDRIRTQTKFALIAEKKEEIGKNKIRALFAGAKKRSIYAVAYDALKMLSDFGGAVDL